ncbi:heparinase II/III family protein [Micromonospora inaquosa]|uniref:Heparinase n=1 Tax=Micromonospora inaquosa TaxID=2203716 RepID=A0A3N9WQF2_9ACTN|nr:heparinase II/III family protein [Micromonospora inaquosa]RQX03000.1 hypothetical protein DLJ59_13650 [Micromonospora inaquosa]
MAAADRFTGPLASAWPDVGVARLEGLLTSPELALPVPPAHHRDVWAEPHVHGPTLADLRATAERDRTTPWPTPLASQYARYHRYGDRETYERQVFARQRRLTRASLIAAVTLDNGWLDEIVDGVTLLCEQSSWCWPAHDDTHTVHGTVLPTVTDPYLDLGAGEVAAQLAWIDHLLGEPLDVRAPGLRARIRYEVDRRVLTPFTTRRDWHWLGLDGDVHNWNPWIHGNVLVAALRLVDDQTRRAALVDLVVEGLDRYVAALPADGAVDEGYDYWWNGVCRVLEALDILAHAAGGALDDVPGDALRHSVAFPHRMHLGGPWYLNHADGAARPAIAQPWHALHRAARRVGDRDAQAHAAAHRRPDAPVAGAEQGLGRLLRALTDPSWVHAAPGMSPLPRDVWLPSTQVMLARRTAGSAEGLTLALKGGHNGEHHNHNDVGSVVIALNGVPVLVDAGRPTYTAQTFGPDRYGIWTMQSAWHNVPHPRATGQSPGRGFTARQVTHVADDIRSAATMDIAPAYPRSDLRYWWRAARFDRHGGHVEIVDTWEFDPAVEPPPTHVHLLVAGEVRLADGRAEITALDGAGRIGLSWRPASALCAATVRPIEDPMLFDVWGARLHRLAIDVTAFGPSGELVLTVEELPPHEALLGGAP